MARDGGDALRRWLVHLADPLAPAARRPREPLASVDLVRLGRLAEAHGVLPAVARNLAAMRVDLRPAHVADAALSQIAARRAAVVGLSMLLARHGGEIARALQRTGVPALIVKGAALARRAYPEPALRTFTDIDILVPRPALTAAGAVLVANGFASTIEEYGRRSDRGEQKWIAPQTGFLVELHSNLVGSPKLRDRVSLGYDDVMASATDGEPNSETLLLIACVHGATGHQFDRLQHLVDIMQLARGAAGPVDAEALWRRAGSVGGLYAVKSGLELAGLLFGEPRCLELSAAVGRVRFAGLARRLLTPAVVISAQDATRRRHSWRRKIARELIVWSR